MITYSIPINNIDLLSSLGLSKYYKILVRPLIKKIRIFSNVASTKKNTKILKGADLFIKFIDDDNKLKIECYWWMNGSRYYNSNNIVSIFMVRPNGELGASIGKFLIYKVEDSYHPVFLRAWKSAKCVYATCYIDIN